MTKKELLEMINEMPDQSKIYANGNEVTFVILRKEKSVVSEFLSKNEIYIESTKKKGE